MGRAGNADEERVEPQVQIRPYHDDDGNDADGSSAAAPSNDFDRDTSTAIPPWHKRASSHMPHRLKRAWHGTITWIKGPDPPRRYSIKPILPRVQHAPLKLLNHLAPKTFHKVCVLIAVYGLWLLSFGLVLWSSNAAAEVSGYGSPVILACTSTFWSAGNGCGINGDQCRPFTNSTMAFRCPAACASAQVLNPHAVGDQEVVYQSLTIGGPVDYQTGFEGVIENDAVYRGDSFICGAAVHAGFISNSQGGCGVTTLTGEQPDFPASNANGISSIGFNSYFPLSFGFMSGTRTECKDLWWPALLVSVFFSVFLGIFVTNPAVFFWSMFIGMFVTVALATDPPYAVTFYGLLSTAAGRFLPAAFCAAVMYHFSFKRSLTDLTAQLEKTVLWIGAAWVGALNNYTFDQIPIQRLTSHDIQAQPGAIPALIIIVSVLVVVAIGQAWAFRVEGRMPRYLGLYGLMVLGLLILLALPGVSLRIHHYILALLLLPGTSFQNRPSLLYQGLLTGLFVDGTARWGFDSIIQTPAQLYNGAQQDSLLPIVTAIAVGLQNITFDLGQLPVYDVSLDLLYDGFSVLINDVEKFHGYNDEQEYFDTISNSSISSDYTWTWTRRHQNASALPEYFRFAYVSGSTTVDYTMAGVWDASGNWTEMEPGPSRRR